jgi:hypothetical protein
LADQVIDDENLRPVVSLLVRAFVLIAGCLLTHSSIQARLAVSKTFQTFSGSGNEVMISADFQNMMAWIDVYNLGMYSGVAIMLIAVFGWRGTAQDVHGVMKRILPGTQQGKSPE